MIRYEPRGTQSFSVMVRFQSIVLKMILQSAGGPIRIRLTRTLQFPKYAYVVQRPAHLVRNGGSGGDRYLRTGVSKASFCFPALYHANTLTLTYPYPSRTGSISSRPERLDSQLQSHARGRGFNFLAHSMGGLDCRHLISHIRPAEYVPLSLTTISTPHRRSPFMDWCVVSF